MPVFTEQLHKQVHCPAGRKPGKSCMLNEEAAKMYLEDLEGFEAKARQCTITYAMSGETT
jgi:hypothetical protein